MRLTALQGFGPIIPLLLDSVLRRNDWLGSGAGLFQPVWRRPHWDPEAAVARTASRNTRHFRNRPETESLLSRARRRRDAFAEAAKPRTRSIPPLFKMNSHGGFGPVRNSYAPNRWLHTHNLAGRLRAMVSEIQEQGIVATQELTH